MNGGADSEVADSAGQSQPPEWKFAQVFGERTAGEEVQEGMTFFVWIRGVVGCFYGYLVFLIWIRAWLVSF